MNNFLLIITSIFVISQSAFAAKPCQQLFTPPKESRGVSSEDGQSYRNLKMVLHKEQDKEKLKNIISNLWNSLQAKQNRGVAYKEALTAKAQKPAPFLKLANDTQELKDVASHLMKNIWQGDESNLVEKDISTKLIKKSLEDC